MTNNHETTTRIPETTIENIIARLEKELERYGSTSDSASAMEDQIMLAPLRDALRNAERLGRVGEDVTPMTSFPRLLRPFAMLAGRLVLFLSRFIIDRQCGYNTALINIMHQMIDSFAEMQREQRVGFQYLADSLLADIATLKLMLAQQERRTATILAEAKSCLPDKFSDAQLQRLAAEENHLLDPFYAAFEERFRGSREQIHARLQPYLPLIREAAVGTLDAPLLDVGCGRGEWLELLRNAGLTARGIDLNKVFVEQCKEMGLDVQEGEALATLRGLPDDSLGGVSGFHIVEHLPLDTLIALFDEALRVIRPGGMLIFETPNPENLLVGSCNFYFDPTHRNPIPAPTLQFIAESRGFANVGIMKLNPSTALPVREEGEVAQRFNMYFYGPMEYALIARKAVS